MEDVVEKDFFVVFDKFEVLIVEVIRGEDFVVVMVGFVGLCVLIDVFFEVV